MGKRRRGEGCIYRPKGTANWWIKYHLNGKPYAETSGSPDRRAAEKLLKGKLARRTLGQLIPGTDRITFEDMTTDVTNDYKVNGKKSFNRMVDSLDHLKSYFVGYKAQAITTDRIKAYSRERQENGAANGTINRELSALKRMFNLAIQAGRIYQKPYIPMLKEDNVRSGFFELGEFLAARDAMADYLKPVVTFAYYTGWRKSEILKLRWNQVDLEAQIVRLEPGTTKSGKGRIIALEGELLELIQAQWEKRKVAEIPGESTALLCPFVFHRNGKPIKDLRKAWIRACAVAGVSGRIFHDLRRTAIRNMVRAGIPERVVMAISGHKTRSVFDRYNIVNEEDLKEAARKTTEHAEKQRTTAVVTPLKKGSNS